MRRILPLFLSILLLAGLCTSGALAAIDLDSPDWVVDDANILSQELEEKIIEANQTLEYDCQGAQLVVVTVTYPTAGMDREEFAKEIFDTWNIGSSEYNNGSLLVIYTESNEFWLECGYGIYNSPFVDEIADMVADDSAFYRSLRKGNYESAVSTLVGGLTDWYTNYYGSTANGGNPNVFNGNTVVRSEGSSDSLLSIILGLILLYIFVRMILSPFTYRRRYGRWGVWPFVYYSSWWNTRPKPRRTYTPIVWTSTNHTHSSGSHHSSSGFSSFGSSSHSSHSSHSSGGFGGHSGGGFHGGGFHGGGGHSGGGFGHR